MDSRLSTWCGEVEAIEICDGIAHIADGKLSPLRFIKKYVAIVVYVYHHSLIGVSN